MVQIALDENDKIDWAVKFFRKKVDRAGILKELRKRRHYEKPSEVRKRKAAAARRKQALKDRPRRTGGGSKRGR